MGPMVPMGPKYLLGPLRPNGAQVPFRVFKDLWAHGAQVPFRAFKALWAHVAHGVQVPLRAF